MATEIVKVFLRACSLPGRGIPGDTIGMTLAEAEDLGTAVSILEPEEEVEAVAVEGGLCQGKTTKGKACKKKALPEGDYCKIHLNKEPEEAEE